ncbi:MAG TPA: sialidase family protein, partial [Nevskiaceae bacterium]|nr:sialidase family protein [Nevskiaceae bacterium]
NTVDPYLVSDRRTGRLFWAHATGPVRNEDTLPQDAGFYIAAASGFQVYTSADNGYSWTTADYQTAPTGDWEQLMVGPPPAGSAQPVGYPDVLYLCANAPFEVTGPGRLCYKSLDGGATFSVAGLVSPTASNPADICAPLQFRNGVVDSAGTLYIPATCQQADYIIASHDEGASWSWSRFPDAPTSSSPTKVGGYLQMAVDDADNLYAMWNDPSDGLLYLETSLDHGASWSAKQMVAAPGLKMVRRPAIAGGAAGQVGIAYYGSSDAAATLFTAWITQTRNGVDAQPLWYSAPLNDPAAPVFNDFALTGGRPRTDFVGGAFDAAGTTFWAGMVKQLPGEEDPEGAGIATVGLVGRLPFDDALGPLR